MVWKKMDYSGCSIVIETQSITRTFWIALSLQVKHRGAPQGDAAQSKLNQKLKQLDKDIADKMQKVS